MLFPQFNTLTNPTEEANYSFGNAPTVSTLTYSEIMTGLRENPDRLILWHIPKDFIVIKVGNHLKLIDMLIDTETSAFVYESKKEACFYVIAKAATIPTGIRKTVTGFPVTYIKNVVPLPFKLKSATSPEVTSYSIVYDKSIGDIPDFLFPHEGKYAWFSPIVGEPTDVLILILRNLPKWSPEKKLSIVTLINKYFCKEPKTPIELEEILAKANETCIDDFFNGKNFMHDVMGEYLIKLLHIKRDVATGELYYYDSVNQIYNSDNQYLLGFITRNYSSLREHQRAEVVSFIKSYLYDEVSEMNSNPYTIVFKNGLLNIRTLELTPMSPEYLESIKINYNYTRYAVSTVADKFFNDLSCNDPEVEQLLYEAIGYALLKTSELQTSFTLLGSGRNGKSTYLDVLKTIVGKKYYTAISYKDLSNNFRASSLIGKLISAVGDASAQPLNDTDLYKSIVGGEDIMLEEKFKDAKTLNLFATMFYACNKLSRTPDTTAGFYRRQTIIPCTADLTGVSKIDGMNFKAELLSDISIETIIYKAVQAIHQVFKRGDFTVSARAEKIKQEYIEDNSAVLSWIKDAHDSNKEKISKMTFSNAWLSYKKWSEDSGRKTYSQTSFKNELRAQGIILDGTL